MCPAVACTVTGLVRNTFDWKSMFPFVAVTFPFRPMWSAEVELKLTAPFVAVTSPVRVMLPVVCAFTDRAFTPALSVNSPAPVTVRLPTWCVEPTAAANVTLPVPAVIVRSSAVVVALSTELSNVTFPPGVARSFEITVVGLVRSPANGTRYSRRPI